MHGLQLSLNDDVLLLIVSHLHGRDALSLSLASKRMHALAAARVAAVVECKSPSQLLRLHRYLLSTCLRRGRFRLRALHIERLHIDELALGPGFVPEFSHLHLLTGILLHAPNVIDLDLPYLDSCSAHDPRIGEAISCMHRLEVVKLDKVCGRTLEVLSLAPTIKDLRLTFHANNDNPTQKIMLLPLLSLLAGLTSLHTLCLADLNLASHPVSSSSLPPLLSLRSLTLFFTSFPALDIILFLPNLSSLAITTAAFIFNPEDGRTPATRWRPLRRLSLSGNEHLYALTPHVGMVDELALDVNLYSDDFSDNLCDIILAASPIKVDVNILFFSAAPLQGMRISVLAACSRLCSLTLTLRLLLRERPTVADAVRDWAHVFDQLATLPPLKFLSISLSALAGFQIPAERAGDITQWLGMAAQECYLVQRLRALPHRLVKSNPTLRYLSVEDIVVSSWLSTSELLGGLYKELGMDNQGIESILNTKRWWRVDDGGVLVPISEREGREGQRLVEAESLSSAE